MHIYNQTSRELYMLINKKKSLTITQYKTRKIKRQLQIKIKKNTQMSNIN